MSFVVGVYYALIALTEFSNSYWLYNYHVANVYSLAGQHLLWWGIFDTIIAVTAIAAGVSLLRGGFFGILVGISGAGFSAIRWLFYLAVDPWVAAAIIAIDVLIIYGLTSSMDYFADSDDIRSGTT